MRVDLGDRSEAAEAAYVGARQKAISRMKDAEVFRLEDFTFYGYFPGELGDYVVQVVRDGRHILVEAPAQILVVEPFQDGRANALSVIVEARKHVRTRTLAEMDAALRHVTSKGFPRVERFRMVRIAALRRAILKEWPRVAETSAIV